MAETTTTPPIFYWIGNNWYWLTAIASGMGLTIWLVIKAHVLRPISRLETTQAAIIRIVPVQALEKGLMLQTSEDCHNRRTACNNHIITEELAETMRIIKQAIYLLVTHNKEIPDHERDSIVKELMD